MWHSGTDKFLKVEIAPQSGSSCELQGTTQLLSVPYAMYSEKTRLIAGNAINITNGNTISANYQPGTGINITGSTISHNLIAGTDININGNLISATDSGSGYWLPHSNGIYYDAGKVGIGTMPNAIAPLTVMMPNTGTGNVICLFNSNDTWHSGLTLRNNSNQYTFVAGGPNNTESRFRNFGLYNGNLGLWALIPLLFLN